MSGAAAEVDRLAVHEEFGHGGSSGRVRKPGRDNYAFGMIRYARADDARCHRARSKLFPTPDDAETAFYEAFERARPRGDDGGVGRERRRRLRPSARRRASSASTRCARAGRRSSRAARAAARAHDRACAASTARRVAVHTRGRGASPPPGERAPGSSVSRDQRLRAHRGRLAHGAAPRHADAEPERERRAARAKNARASHAAHAALSDGRRVRTRSRHCCIARRWALVARGAGGRPAQGGAHAPIPSAESKLDPQAESDEARGAINDNIFDALLAVRLPRAAREAAAARRGGAARGDRRRARLHDAREARHLLHARSRRSAASRASSPRRTTSTRSKRLFDPAAAAASGSSWSRARSRAPTRWWRRRSKTGRFDYDRPIEGLRALDRYTLRIELDEPDYSFPYVLAMPATAARRARGGRALRRRHRAPSGGHRALRASASGCAARASCSRRIPATARSIFESEGADDAYSQEIAARLAGQAPAARRAASRSTSIDEAQPRWLAFLNDEHDYIRPLPEEFADIAMPGGELAPNLAKRGIRATPDEIA